MANIAKLAANVVTDLTTGGTGQRLACQVARHPKLVNSMIDTAVTTVGPVVTTTVTTLAPVAVVAAAGYGAYRFIKWIFD